MKKIKCNELKECTGGMFSFQLGEGVVGFTPSTLLKQEYLEKYYNKSGRDVKLDVYYGFWLKGEDLYIVHQHTDSILNKLGESWNNREKERIEHADFSPAYKRGWIKLNMSWGKHNRVEIHDYNPSIWVMCGDNRICRKSLNILTRLADTLCRRMYRIDDSVEDNSQDANFNSFDEFKGLIYEPREFKIKYKNSLQYKYIYRPEP